MFRWVVAKGILMTKKEDHELPILKTAPTRAEIINALNVLKDAIKEVVLDDRYEPYYYWTSLSEWLEVYYEEKQ